MAADTRRRLRTAGIHALLIVWVLYSVPAVLLAVLTSIKKPVEANSRTPKLLGFQPTSGNYAELWLNMPAGTLRPMGSACLR